MYVTTKMKFKKKTFSPLIYTNNNMNLKPQKRSKLARKV